MTCRSYQSIAVMTLDHITYGNAISMTFRQDPAKPIKPVRSGSYRFVVLNAPQQSALSGAKEAGEDRQRNTLLTLYERSAASRTIIQSVRVASKPPSLRNVVGVVGHGRSGQSKSMNEFKSRFPRPQLRLALDLLPPPCLATVLTARSQ